LLFVRAREAARDRRTPPPREALLVGDPAFSPRDPDHWSRLAGAGDEIRAIAACWPRATVITGAEARAGRLRQMAASGALGRYALLHFATHTALDPVHALESALVLAPETPGAASDSRLAAREVAESWKLDADLVCIAGCQSNLGVSSSSDGLLGLQEAFLSAGARSLLVSIWPVDDRATARLMQEFYTRLADSAHPVDRATALREAQVALRAWREPDGRRPFAHPAYWSAFALIGDPD
jgi:CHAT domain-containing protein